MDIDDVTEGNSKADYLVRYRGRVRGDTAAAYDQLAGALRPLDVTPLFRKEKDRHLVFLVSGVVRPKPSKAWVNVLLFFLALASMLFAGTFFYLSQHYEGPPEITFRSALPYLPASLADGLMFTVSLMSILLAHEFGHYLAGRFHRTHVTLPYFIPFPLPPFGTMGAFIQLKEPPKNKRILLDIGIAGPLAGLIVAVPVLLLGLSLSQVNSIPSRLPPGYTFQLEGNSLLYLLSKFVVFGQLLPEPSSYGSMGPLVYWVRYFFTGRPIPWGGMDVILHPVAWAAWAGLLVTALNLIPAGQLDGGHLMYVLLGRRASLLVPFILVGLILLGMFWPGWWLWAFLIFLLGRLHAEPLDQITPLDPSRRVLAVVGVIVFLLVFTPVPLLQAGF
jgi:membrane-associated protease RseP (regulator of RpoE activity)